MTDDPPAAARAADGFRSLAEMFQLQDKWQSSNRDKARAEFALIEQGLTLAVDLSVWLVSCHERRACGAGAAPGETPEFLRVDVIRANLLHAAFATLVSATRLALFGDFVDALALTRTAFEAIFHAEYFRDHPCEALVWDGVGQTADVLAMRRQLEAFNSRTQVRTAVARKYPGAEAESFRRWFAELSTYGTHINPKTVGLRLATGRPQAGNLGFVAAGYDDAPVLCASYVLHTLAYALSEFRDGFGPELANQLTLSVRLQRFEGDTQAHYQAVAPHDLSLLR